MFNPRIANPRQQANKDSNDESSNKIDLKDEKVINKILESNNQIRKKIPLVFFFSLKNHINFKRTQGGKQSFQSVFQLPIFYNYILRAYQTDSK